MFMEDTDSLISILAGLACIFTLAWMYARAWDCQEEIDLANCKSCGAPIRWIRMTSNKMMPIDAQPSPAGTVEIVDGYGYVVKTKEPSLLPGEERYTSHFATCPNAAQHRQRPA
jgi:hypothetical protein